MAWRILNLTIDVDAVDVVDSGGKLLDEHDTFLFLDDGTQLRLTLISGGAPFVVPATAALQFGIRAAPDSRYCLPAAGPYLIFSDTDQWNLAGDWAETDPALGKLSCRVRSNTAELAAALSVESPLIGLAEIQMQDPPGSGEKNTLAQFRVKLIHDVVGDPAAPGTPLPDPYVNASSVQAMIDTALTNPFANWQLESGQYMSMWDYGLNRYRRVILNNGAIEVNDG